jgi:hypothetical protein
VESIDRFKALIDINQYRKKPITESIKILIDSNLRLLAFLKPERYIYQQELRVYIYCAPTEKYNHLNLYIGDLRSNLLTYGEFEPLKDKTEK